MKRLLHPAGPKHTSLLLTGLLALFLSAAGCGKNSPEATPAQNAEAAPATIENAFRDAPTEVKQQATEAVASLQSRNDSAAFVQLQNLSGRPDLTPEQRRAAFESWMAVNLKLQQAADSGNSAAKELLDKYRASK